MTKEVGETKTRSRYRELTKIIKYLLVAFTVIALGSVIYFNFRFSFLGVFRDLGIYYFLIALFLPCVFLIFPLKKADQYRLPWYDILACVLSFAGFFYLFLRAGDITLQGWEAGLPSVPVDVLIICIIEWVLILEAIRRCSGIILAIIVLFFSIYPLFANVMPAVLLGLSFDIDTTITRHFLSSESVVGIVIRIFVDLIIGFMFFATCLQVLGGGKFFLDLANSLLGQARGGAAKVCVVGSGLMAMISGSVFANILTVGGFTIPAMRKSGYSPVEAAAIETCSSTAGVLAPPIMGATAFVMASLLGVPYVNICIAAAIPSFLFYWSLFWSVDTIAFHQKIMGLPRESLPRFLHTLAWGWPYIVAFIVLIYFLVVLRIEKQGPWIAALILILIAFIRKETRPNIHTFSELIEGSGKQLCELTAIMAGIGMIMGGLNITGAAHSLSAELIDLAGGSILLLVLLGAIANLILGMGMTITACYIITAVIVAPALIKLGLNTVAVHIFLMYYGMLSYITPPVALGAYVAGNLVGESGFKVGIRASRLGIPLFLLPFFFVFNPALVAQASGLAIVEAILFCIVGFWLLASGMEGYLRGIGKLAFIERILVIIVGVLVAFPERVTSLVGIGIGITFFILKFFLVYWFRVKKSNESIFEKKDKRIEEKSQY